MQLEVWTLGQGLASGNATLERMLYYCTAGADTKYAVLGSQITADPDTACSSLLCSHGERDYLIRIG